MLLRVVVCSVGQRVLQRVVAPQVACRRRGHSEVKEAKGEDGDGMGDVEAGRI